MEGIIQQASMSMDINIPGLQIEGTAQQATEVLCLMNMVNKDELEDDEEYEGWFGLTILPLPVASLFTMEKL